MDEDFVAGLGPAFTAHRLRRLSDAFVDACGQWLARQGLSAPPRSISTLRLLLESEPLAVTEIAARIRLSHPFIVRTVADLERLGLVTLGRDAKDKRKRMVGLTDKGRAEAQAFLATAEPLAAAYASLFEDAGIDLAVALDAVEKAHRAKGMAERLP
jgi:DNA-binding MarR family transcriptional regulator